MKTVVWIIFSFLYATTAVSAPANVLPVGEPVVMVFASGNQVEAVISSAVIDPITGVFQFQFRANPASFQQGTVAEGLVMDEVVDIRWAATGDSITNGTVAKGAGEGASRTGLAEVGGAVGEGLIAGGTAVFVGILTAGSTPSEVWKKMKKMSGIVNGLLKAYATYRASILKNGSQNTQIMNDVQDHQKAAFDQLHTPPPTFLSTDPDLRSKIDEQSIRYQNFQPKSLQQARLKAVGQGLLRNADDLSVSGEKSAAELSLKYAIDIADVLVGIDPVTGAIRNIFELYTGRNLITGEVLSFFQRSSAGVGVLLDLATFGTGGTLLRGARVLGKVFPSFGPAQALQEATKTVGLLQRSPSVKNRSGLLYSDMKVVSAEAANAGHKVPPWSSEHGVIVEATLRNNERYIRFYAEGSSKPLSEWVSNHTLQGKTLEQVVNGLALPNTPTRLAIVEVAAGSRVRFGFSADAFGKPGGMIQHQILTSPLSGGGALSPPYQAVKMDVSTRELLDARGRLNL